MILLTYDLKHFLTIGKGEGFLFYPLSSILVSKSFTVKSGEMPPILTFTVNSVSLWNLYKRL